MRIKNPQMADLVTFTEEILNGKFIICAVLLVSVCWFLQSFLKFWPFSKLISNESPNRMLAMSKKGKKLKN